MKRFLLVMIWLALIPHLITAAETATTPAVNYPIYTGAEEVIGHAVYPPYPTYDNQDLVGTTEIIGTTWYEVQHNGTIGRMVEKDPYGYFHFCWTNGLNYGASDRHVYYNFIDPAGNQGWPGVGTQVESSVRGGFCTVDADTSGRVFTAFHWQHVAGGDYITTMALDFVPHSGTFITYEPSPVPGVQAIWPRMRMDGNNALHIVSTEYVTVAGDPQRHYYTRGTYDPVAYSITYDPWEEMTWTMTIAADVATSEVSNRVAFGWTYCRDEGFPGGSPSQWNNDLYLLIDEDGLAPNWGNALNVTTFIPPDPSYLPDTTMAEMDTFRVYTDMSLFFDDNDYLHAAFTTPSYFEISGYRYWHASLIWHWSEMYPDDFHLIHNAFDDWWWNSVDCGAWNMKAQRPSLAQDPVTGYLYCTYQVFDVDTTALSAAGWPSGEVYVSVSTDGGLSWAVGTNITETITPENAAPGECLSEAYPSMAKVVDGECHIMYVLDRDAGAATQPAGTWTLNDVVYHQVPVDSIPTTPLVPDTVLFHVASPPPVPQMVVDVNYVSGSPVPAGGGTLYYAIWGQNQEPVPLDWDAWIDMIYMPGTPVADTFTVVMREITNYLPGWTINRPDVWFPVPGYWANGEWELRIYSGWHPEYIVWHTDAFNWVKDGPVDLDFDFEANLPIAGFPDPFDQIGVTQEDYTVPADFAVYGAYPNPFNPTTTIRFTLPQDERVLLSVFDVNGRLVETLVDGNRGAGIHEVTFDASHLASGIYLYRLKAGTRSVSGKMVLMK